MLKKLFKRINTCLKEEIGPIFFKLDPRFSVMVGLTYNCQCDCVHCGMKMYKRKSGKELSKEEILKIIDKLSFFTTKNIYFFGGEPLLRNDIFELIEYAHKKLIRTYLDTNGYLLTKEVVKKLKKAGLDLIQVSIDSPYSINHNILRKKENSFERAVAGIKECLFEGIFCSISTYATKENINNGDLKKIILLGKQLGVNRIRILSPIMAGRWLKSEGIKLSDEDKNSLKKIGKLGPIYLEESLCQTKIKRLFYVSPYGDVQPCCYVPIVFGNVRDEQLKSILKRMWKHRMFKTKTDGCPMNNDNFRKEYFSDISLSTESSIKPK